MTNSSVISQHIRRSLLAVEITILVVSVWVNINNIEFQTSPVMVWELSLFVGAILPFSLWFPIYHPLWQRRVYIFSAISILAIASHFRISFDSLLLLFLLKGCFILPRREVILAAIIYGSLIYSSLWLRLPSEFNLIRDRGIEIYLNPVRIITNNVIMYLGSCTFVLLLGSVWAEEQKAKRRAEALTVQVESLAADLERNRIARDIHDSLGHSLTTLDIQIELAQRFQSIDLERSQESLAIAKTLTQQCLDEVRRTLRTMQSSQFDLTEAVIKLVEQVKQNQSFQVQLEINLPELSLQTSYQLYCIVQESLTNIQKHAHASQVVLKGKTLEHGISLMILDNGRGFDQNSVSSGFGLRNMEERVQCLAGKLHLHSVIDQGTQIEIFVPS
jgi:signal transduction histidine kinase